MRALITAMLLLATTPAMAGTLCDDLSAVIRRGDGSSFRAIASKSNGRISEAKSTFEVPVQYKPPGFDNPRMYSIGSNLVATVDTQGTMHCQEWAFFRRSGKRVHRIKEPATVAPGEGGLCWDSYALVARFGDVPALVIEDKSDNGVSLSITPWQERRWGPTCHLAATFKPRLEIDQYYCAQNDCAPLGQEAIAIAEWHRGFSPRSKYPQKDVDQRSVRLAEQLPNPRVIPEFGKTTSNPYSQFADEEVLIVRAKGQELLAMVGGGLFGWRDYRGNLVAFWRQDGEKLVPVASFQIGLEDGNPISLELSGAK